MMQRATTVYRRFLASTRGIAAVEFAMVLPVLALLFLASFDGGRAISIYMKVRAATYALDAITNQYSTIQSTDMTSIVGATSAVLAPYSNSPLVVTISQLSIANSSASHSTVSWSYSLNGTALAQNSSVSIPAGLLHSSTYDSCGSYPCYLIMAQTSYTYTPMFGYFGSGGITMSDQLYTTPRISACILYPPQSVSSC